MQQLARQFRARRRVAIGDGDAEQLEPWALDCKS
jgi:hypothetical protein